jgi:hemerythrin
MIKPPNMDLHIVWDDSLKTGIEVIDVQHQQLINLYNELLFMTDYPEGTIIKHALTELTNYSKYHFATEEAIMYGDLDEISVVEKSKHITEHEFFTALAATLTEELEVGIIDIRQKTKQIINFIRTWIVHHVTVIDSVFKLVEDGGSRITEIDECYFHFVQGIELPDTVTLLNCIQNAPKNTIRNKFSMLSDKLSIPKDNKK